MTTNKAQFVYVTYINTTPEKVWAALMDGEMTKQYWGMKKNVSDWKVGSKWTHQDYETDEVAVTGHVVEIDPPNRLVLTWAHPLIGEGGTDGPSRVTFAIEPFMGSVRLTVTHEDLVADSAGLKAVSSGWPGILSSLKSLLETGKPLEMTTRRWGK